jgi:hypothetical protein
MRRRIIGAAAAASIAFAAGIGGLTVGIASAAQSSPVTYKVVEKDFVVQSGATKVVTISCPAGLKPVGGGAHYGVNEFPAVAPSAVSIADSDLSLSHRGWSVAAYVSSSSGASSFTADVICASW